MLAGALFLVLAIYGVAKYGGCASDEVVAVAESASAPSQEQEAEPRRIPPQDRKAARAPRPKWMSERSPGKERITAPHPTATATEEATAPTATPNAEGDEREAIDRAVKREEAIREEMRKVPIEVYMTTWCPVCTKARGWLAANGYRFTEYDVDRDSAARRRKKKLDSAGGVPTIHIDGAVQTGFSPRWIEKQLRSRAERKLRR